MTGEQRRYLFVESAAGSAIVNGLINGAIGWAATRGMPEFPIWRIPGVAVDVIATAFGVAFGTCLGTALQVRLDLSRGKIAPPASLPPWLTTLAERRPVGLARRAAVFGALAVPMFAPLILLGLALSGVHALHREAFITLKVGLSFVEGALLTPFIVLSALLDTRDARPSS